MPAMLYGCRNTVFRRFEKRMGVAVPQLQKWLVTVIHRAWIQTASLPNLAQIHVSAILKIQSVLSFLLYPKKSKLEVCTSIEKIRLSWITPLVKDYLVVFEYLRFIIPTQNTSKNQFDIFSLVIICASFGDFIKESR